MAASALPPGLSGGTAADGLSPPPHLAGCRFLLIYLLIQRHLHAFIRPWTESSRVPRRCLAWRQPSRGRSLCDSALRCKWGPGWPLPGRAPQQGCRLSLPAPLERLRCQSSPLRPGRVAHDKCPSMSISFLITQPANLVSVAILGSQCAEGFPPWLGSKAH